MRRALLTAHLVWAALIFLPSSVLAAGSQMMTHLRGPARAPIGYVEFCRQLPEQCAAIGATSDLALTKARRSQLSEVNLEANRRVAAVTDQERYGVPERWTLPTNAGDCEDYVLLKRKRLIELGWPTSALLITVVFDERGDGHAVLIVRAGGSELVLDNKTDAILTWDQTDYTYVKTQSASDPNQWVAIGDDRAGRPVSTASKR